MISGNMRKRELFCEELLKLGILKIFDVKLIIFIRVILSFRKKFKISQLKKDIFRPIWKTKGLFHNY